MAVSAINDVNAQKALLEHLHSTSKVETDTGAAFDNLLNSAISMYKEADDLQNAAEESEINFALGYATSTHDLAIAQQKANISLQYTVKVTSKAIEAYKELMNMQI
ncbi:MAG: flagellar hook-basal body complex protein FliE [Bacteroidales bacterium]|nr:flagellar hook-basal body complex protein FliE [Clostridium sp.]MCM1202719.1 flagellar hook-basal body complex protein FliE [Bacteroidales bacterium]